MIHTYDLYNNYANGTGGNGVKGKLKSCRCALKGIAQMVLNFKV